MKRKRSFIYFSWSVCLFLRLIEKVRAKCEEDVGGVS